MRFFIVSNPATGQVNPLLAISHELCLRGHQVVLASSDPILKKIAKLQAKLGYPQQVDLRPSRKTWGEYPLMFYSLGSGQALDDYTDEASSDPERFHTRGRSPPGQIWDWVHTFMELVPAKSTVYRDVVFHIRDIVEEMDPDMLIVDNFSPFAVDGARLTKRPFIETSPGASSAVVNSFSLYDKPMPMSGARDGHGGLLVFLHNLVFIFMWLKFVLFNPWPRTRRAFRRELGLEPVDLICDSLMTPTPGMLPQQVATITFNVAGTDYYPADAYDNSVFFVGPCLPPKEKPRALSPRAPMTPITSADMSPISTASTPTVVDMPLEKELSSIQVNASEVQDPVKLWLNQAYYNGCPVVYINLGSIFYYRREDYDNMIEALKQLREKVPNVQVLWKVPDLPYKVQPIPPKHEAHLPDFIRRETWLESVQTVLEHPATAVCVHHGGGNSYNEAMYYGIPQFGITQWVDTHDVGAFIKHSGVGIWADKSPQFDPKDISEKLSQIVLDEGHKFQRNALSWKVKTRQAGGTKVAADIIESYVSQFKYPSGSSKLPWVDTAV